MTKAGHNENAVRLSALAGDAQIALDKVGEGEAAAIEGWLAYGATLNEARALFPGDREFGQWVAENVLNQLGRAPHTNEQQAAMWAAANADQFEEARAAGNARTVRGIHAQWKKIEAEREAAEADAKRKAEAAERAEAAKAEAGAKAAEEAEARKAAAEAKTDDERQAAEQRADKAKAEADEAKQEAEKATEEAEPEPESDPDPHRKGLSSFTREGLEDEVVGLRATVVDLTKRVEDQRGQIADLKAKVKELSSDNKGKTISDLQKRLEAAKYRRDEALRVAKREEYKRKQAEKRAADLEQIEVPYG